MPKVLIVHPDFSRLGGIENYYRKLRPYLKVANESFGNSRRSGESGAVARVARILGDYYRYWKKLADSDIDIVHLNPSFEPAMFYRESVFLWLARLRGKKTIVFFRGWSESFERAIDRRRGFRFRLLYGKADVFIVLASSFRDKLQQWRIRQPVYRESTIIDDDAIAGFDPELAVRERMHTPRWRVLFPSRLLKSKGVMTAIRAMGYLRETHPEFELIVAGDGELADEAKAYVRREELDNVRFVGVVSGEDKLAMYRSAHMLCFPTEHDEGFPNTIVEAMAFGLPVITRPVGGIRDFFVSGEHGYITESTDPESFARLIQRVAESTEQYQLMALANHRYACEHFLASQAARRLENIYASL